MTLVPQVIVTLSPEGELVAELPGSTPTRRQVPLASGHVEQSLRRMLEAQQEGNFGIGLDGAPTAAQARHWQQHEDFPNERCAFCRAEGRVGGVSSYRRKEFMIVANGVKARFVPSGKSGLPKKAKKAPRAPTRVVAKTRKSAEEMGL